MTNIKNINILNVLKNSNLFWIFVAGFLSLFIWSNPFIGFILYPFKLFVTYIHELSHGLSALLTGGHFYKLIVNIDSSGLAYTSGGFRPLVISAGYLGSSIFGILILFSALENTKVKKIIVGVLGSIFILSTLFFARSILAFITGLLLGGILIALIKYSNPIITLFLGILGIQSTFFAFNDIITLFYIDSFVQSDALTMSKEIAKGLLPPSFFALLWFIFSVVIFIFFVHLYISSNRKKFVD